MLTTTAFAALRPIRDGVRSLDYLFTLRVCHLVSTPSSHQVSLGQTWPDLAMLGSGLPYRFRDPGFPEFDRFYKRA